MAHAFKSVYVPAFPKPRQEKKEVPWIKIHRDGREVLNTKTERGGKEYAARKWKMYARQEGTCCLYGFNPDCPGRMRKCDASFEHEDGRSAGRHDDRIELPNGDWINGCSHILCNSWKGSRKIPYNDARNEARRANSEQG